MIDEIRIWVCLLNDPEAVERLARAPAYVGSTGEENERGSIRAQHRGIRWDYYNATKRLVGRGSLHSFAHGNNLGRFTADQVLTACNKLAAAVDLPPERLSICGLEAGINIPLAKSPRRFLESLTSHKKAPFTAMNPPPKATRPLLYNAHHADYRIKAYDKGEYSRLQGQPLSKDGPPHLLRYEVKYLRARPLQTLTKLPGLTLADLPKPEVLQALAADVRKHWNLSHRRQHMNYDGLSLSDAQLLHLATDTAFWETMRSTQTRRTYERNYSRAKQLLQERKQPHPYDEVLARELAQVLGPLPVDGQK
ncbi:hypothetical protein [Hymenobacter glacieicola]|uniref:Uncharacterized protein n=1 Tax=Hymenobacter glacieicola TaxID=1562124 RepID=A0ABQ1WFC2_9BACT|nr:hypothetical protein [Hymenobacter glacieicola]GGG29226.1 hypothetical protein GCM10011378_02360 [Hymenobacter glacieicola]